MKSFPFSVSVCVECGSGVRTGLGGIRKDEEIIALKTAIKKSYQLKYDNGISPMSDLITATNKEAEARSNQSIHEVQLLMSLYNLKTINGN